MNRSAAIRASLTVARAPIAIDDLHAAVERKTGRMFSRQRLTNLISVLVHEKKVVRGGGRGDLARFALGPAWW
jgi:hypothetical protein